MWHVIVGGFHHLELHLVFLLQRHGSEGRDSEQGRNVCFRRGVGVVVAIRLGTVEDVSVRLGGWYLKTCSINYLLGNGF